MSPASIHVVGPKLEPGSRQPAQGTGTEIQPEVMGHLLTRLVQAGSVAHENFVTLQKLVDTDYLHGRQAVSLAEALGVRQIASEEVPAGPEPAETSRRSPAQSSAR